MENFDKLLLQIAICLVFQAIFNAAETAFFSLSKIDLKKLEKDNKASSKKILSLLKKPKQLLITALLGTNLASIYATAQATLYTLAFAKSHEFTLAHTSLLMTGLVVVMTSVQLVFGDIIPKLYAFSKPIAVASFTTYLLYFVRFVFYPVIAFLEWMLQKFSRKKAQTTQHHTSISSDDLRNIVKSEANNLPLEESEKRIIDSIFRFSDTTAKEIMVPRVDIEGVEMTANLEELKKIIIECGKARIPVYNKTLDEIVGVIYAKDLILHPEKKTLQTLKRKIAFIPENMKIEKLLAQFQSTKKTIAIVVDEYGGTAGLVTIEDILEEIVGEIMDEYDDDLYRITKLSDDNYLLSAMVPVSEINREFNLDLDEEFDNLAEFLTSELNHIPQKNEKYVYKESAEFVVTQIKKLRIHFVRMRLLREKEE